MRHLWSYSKRISLKGALLVPLLFSKTKNCMHNKCMGLYGNLAVECTIQISSVFEVQFFGKLIETRIFSMREKIHQQLTKTERKH